MSFGGLSPGEVLAMDLGIFMGVLIMVLVFELKKTFKGMCVFCDQDIEDDEAEE